jgi:hypothetical protein
MFAYSPGGEPRRRIKRSSGFRLGRLTATAAALAAAVLVSATVIPAASAGIIVPDPGGYAGPAGVTPVATGVRVIAVGGMAGWLIALIAVGAAVASATAAVYLDRALAANRASLAITPWSSCLTGTRYRPAQRPGLDPAYCAAKTHDTGLPSASASGAPDVLDFGCGLPWQPLAAPDVARGHERHA